MNIQSFNTGQQWHNTETDVCLDHGQILIFTPDENPGSLKLVDDVVEQIIKIKQTIFHFIKKA